MLFSQREYDEMCDYRDELVGQLRDAIDGSVSHNEIVNVKFPGNRQTLIRLLDDAQELSGFVGHDVDWVVTNEGDVDVWAAPEDAETEDAEMVWRLLVNCSE